MKRKLAFALCTPALLLSPFWVQAASAAIDPAPNTDACSGGPGLDTVEGCEGGGDGSDPGGPSAPAPPEPIL